MPRLAVAATRRRGLIVPAAFGLLLFVVGLAGSGASGILPVVLLLIVLPLVVMAHRALGRERRGARPGTGMLEKPGELLFAVVVAVAAGGVMTLVASVVLATAAPTLFGDGRLLIRVLLVVFVLGPCVGLG